MELEQYLERDIITFLDSKIIKKEKSLIDREEDYGIYLTKDYIKELVYALDNDELTKAKKLFDELKDNYSSLPKSSVERKKIYSILEKMYDKIQNYVKIKEGKIEIIREGDSEIFKDRSDTFAGVSSIEAKNAKSHETINGMLTKKKTPDKVQEKNLTVESNILEKSIKSIKGEKYYEEKSETQPEEDIGHSNMYVKESKNLINDTNKSRTKTTELPISLRESSRKRDYSHSQVSDELQLDKLKSDIIEKTSEQVEKLKEYITERLMNELNERLNEEQDAQRSKIEVLKSEILGQAIGEIKKGLTAEKRSEKYMIESVKQEIMDEVLKKAKHLIAINDNQESQTYRTERTIDTDENSPMGISDINPLESIDSRDVITIEEPESGKNEKNIEDTKHNNNARVIYEQAIYHMFDNRFSDAAKLFRKIISIQPKNRAARIRLQECIDKDPAVEYDQGKDDDTDNTYPEPKVEQKRINVKSELRNLKKSLDAKSYDIDDFKEDMNQHVGAMTKKIEKIQKQRIKHKYSNEELQEMYEEAIYTMFQNNYTEASKLFEKILELHPDNKAAKIRLQECLEAMSNA